MKTGQSEVVAPFFAHTASIANPQASAPEQLNGYELGYRPHAILYGAWLICGRGRIL